MDKTIKPTCPRCGNKDLRAERKKAHMYCRNCGYRAHWRQFYEGEREREEVQKLFKKGIIEGQPYIDWQKLENKGRKAK